MQTFTVVMPEHLNQKGHLFGGVMLSWVDKYAWLAAAWEHPGCDLVTVSVEQANFKHAVKNGSILRFEMKKTHTGKTSMTYKVEVYARASRGAEAFEQLLVFTTSVVFVRVGSDGNKMPLNAPVEKRE